MKIVLTTLILCCTGLVNSQDSLRKPAWKFLNQYGISTYMFGFFDNLQSAFFGGNELQVNLISYQKKRHEMAISSGMFFINRSPNIKSNPHMQYFYFPVHLSYKLYSKHNETFWQFSLGRPLIMYEDSKYFDISELWPRYESVTSSPSYKYTKKNILAMHSVRFGYQLNKHFSMHIGEMSYLYTSTGYGIKNLTRICFGLEFKL